MSAFRGQSAASVPACEACGDSAMVNGNGTVAKFWGHYLCASCGVDWMDTEDAKELGRQIGVPDSAYMAAIAGFIRARKAAA